MREMIIFHYMERIGSSHPRALELVALARRVDELGISTIFYTSPIDFETCMKHYGTGFLSRIYENVAVLREVLRGQGHELLDLSLALDSDAFHYHGAPIEHLDERGRRFMAETLHRAIVERQEAGS